MSDRLIIAIDGPSGAGKSTVAKALARELGLKYLDTGAMYRALALKSLKASVPADHADEIASLMSSTDIGFGSGDPQPVFLDGDEVTTDIRQSMVTGLASLISAHTAVRQALVPAQQRIIAEGGYVLDGRDATTVIAPDARVKVYLTASLEERAQRRYRETKAAGEPYTYDMIRLAIEERDHRDINRDDSPLRVHPEAALIDCGRMTVREVVDEIKRLI